MNALARLATRRPVAVTVFAAAVAVLGWTAWWRIPVDLLPDIQSPTIVVSIRSGDRPPSEMERVYGEQIEQRLFTVRGIRSVAQVARSGRLVATVTFDWESDMDLSLVDVQKALAPVSADRDVDEVLIRRFDPREAPVMSVGLVSELPEVDLAELRRIARRQIAPALERLAGVAEVQVLGGREREVRVEVDPYRLQAHGLDLGLVEARVSAANLDLNAGTLEERDRVYLIRGLSRFRSTRDIEAVVLTYEEAADGRLSPVRLGDVAGVREADRDVTHIVRVNGREGVGLSVYKEAGTNTVTVSRNVRRGLEQLASDLSGISFVPVTDEAALVEDSIEDVRIAAIAGVILAVLVLALFLRSLAPTAVVAASVPVSLLGTVFLMSFAGYSLNVMTLAGLALGAGMLI
ncbi:MAG: efflux RND transporter permease subunit, partial [Acidobacteriota bacterium]|nr:efflux RND transporter permease subunit [Acidobacteriota bacterium]